MAAAPRSHHQLPNIGYNTRGIYSTGTPGFPKRSQDHIHRSPPPYSAVSARRHPLSPTPSPGIAFNSIRMDPPYGAKGHAHIPPLLGLTQHGQLMYANGHGPIKIEIHGTIDKGFFLSEGEWTCYRRNYFSCVCSYSLSPMYPNAAMQWTPSTSPTTTYDLFGFSMSIAAVVSESDSHTIELVQHTPKRDKGPTQQPEKVQMAPKPHHQSNHPLANIYQDGHNHRLVGGGSGGALYEGFSQPQGTHPTEHTFERIQFKQATANNGKRRAAQQYYHLVVELYGHVCEAGRGAPDQWLKIAQRKSAKMIVRGRSPGHYQSERRGSTSSGPGNSGGTLSSYQPTVSDYGPGTSMLGSNSYGTGSYDHHQHQRDHYGSNRQHELPMEPVMAVDDVKAMDSSKDYQYYPTPIYESSNDPRHQGIEMFAHRSDPEAIGSTGADSMELSASRLKHEDSTLPSLFYPPSNSFVSRGGCNRYDGKSTSAGYYPTMLPQSS